MKFDRVSATTEGNVAALFNGYRNIQTILLATTKMI
jgi:hypothetical protein